MSNGGKLKVLKGSGREGRISFGDMMEEEVVVRIGFKVKIKKVKVVEERVEGYLKWYCESRFRGYEVVDVKIDEDRMKCWVKLNRVERLEVEECFEIGS